MESVAPSNRTIARKSVDRRARVRDEAARIFAERGYHASTMQEIADAVGFTKASIYYYYKSKEELLFDILTYAHEIALERFAAVDAQGGDPLTRLRRYVAAHLIWYLSRPNLAKVAYRDWGTLKGKDLEVQLQRRRFYAKVLCDNLEQCRRAGLIPQSASIRLMANFIYGAVTMANAWYDPNGPETPEAIGEAFGDMAVAVLVGMKTQEKQPAVPKSANA